MSQQPSQYLCPECRSPLITGDRRCRRGHSFDCSDGVLDLVSHEFSQRLEVFAEAVRDYRSVAGLRLLDESAYGDLPYGEAQRGVFEWRLRCYDLEILGELLRGRPPGSALDVGSYNGWLARHLSDRGHRVTAVDSFDDPHDGLRARRFYPRAAWRSIRMDLLDLSILDRRYDTVIVNRCLQFFPDPLEYLEQVKERVATGGLMVVLGLDVYRDPRRKIKAVAGRQAEFRERYGLDFFLRPTRGYLDDSDLRSLRRRGLRVRSYPQLLLRNLASVVLRHRPRFCFGWWSGDAAAETAMSELAERGAGG